MDTPLVTIDEPIPEPRPQYSCAVELKDGRRFQVDLSASTIKHLRRTKGTFAGIGGFGEKIQISASKIRTITSLTQG